MPSTTRSGCRRNRGSVMEGCPSRLVANCSSCRPITGSRTSLRGRGGGTSASTGDVGDGRAVRGDASGTRPLASRCVGTWRCTARTGPG